MEIIPDLTPEQLFLLLMRRSQAKPLLRDLIARLALRGPLVVLDGGNAFDAFGIARLVRRQTHQVEAVLERIRLARAFTCYQMLALLRGASADRRPKVVIDLLATFQDDSVAEVDKDFLLRECLSLLDRLSRSAPVIVCVCPPTGPAGGFSRMLAQVREVATAFYMEKSEPGPLQPALFE